MSCCDCPSLVEDGDLVLEVSGAPRPHSRNLGTIHDEFATLSGLKASKGSEDIEFKVTAQDALAIKQARLGVVLGAASRRTTTWLENALFEPVASIELGPSETVTLRVANTGLNDMSDFILVAGRRRIDVPNDVHPGHQKMSTFWRFGLFQFTTTQDFEPPVNT